MARLLLGPLLRYVDASAATVWVETDAPATVEVLGATADTFAVGGRHYALVPVTGLRPGEATPYDVVVDGQQVWPNGDGYPAPVVRALDPQRPLRALLASCRRGGSVDDAWLGPDALTLLAARLLRAPRDTWPDLLLLVGDQVYADKLSPAYTAWLRGRRDVRQGPRAQAADLEEYAALYAEAWSAPLVRWLLSTVPSAMLLDDHEVSAGWFLSRAWLAKRERTSWWRGKYAAALASYWVHQHLGNLGPQALQADPLLGKVREEGDGAGLLLDAVLDAPDWSYERDLGAARLVALEGRIRRGLEPGARAMHSPEWLDRLRGDVAHLLVVTPLPVLLAPAIAYGEAWSEAVDAAPLAPVAEGLRRVLDLEHWPAFDASMRAMLDAVGQVAAGGRGRPPRSVLWLSGDVHHGYLAEAAFPELGEAARRCAVWQVVSSPLRNRMSVATRVMTRLGATRPVTMVTRAMARSAHVAPWPVEWRLSDGLLYGNQVAWLKLTEDSVDITLEVARPGHGLVPAISRRIGPAR